MTPHARWRGARVTVTRWQLSGRSDGSPPGRQHAPRRVALTIRDSKYDGQNYTVLGSKSRALRTTVGDGRVDFPTRRHGHSKLTERHRRPGAICIPVTRWC